MSAGCGSIPAPLSIHAAIHLGRDAQLTRTLGSARYIMH
jgi:hypothetical protein